jgi:hypothetical protein
MFILSFSSVEFSVEKIQDIEWNEDAFNNLVLPHDHKYLLQSLVQAHHNEISFDDFIKGKGHGLVITNLFGPPGVGELTLLNKSQIFPEFSSELFLLFSSSRENLLGRSYE